MKKKILKCLSLLLCFSMVFVLLAGINAYAGVRNGEADASLLQEGDYVLYDKCTTYGNSVGLMAVADYDTAAQIVYQGLLNCDTVINIENCGIDKNNVSAFYSNVVNDNPDLFYVSSSISYNYYTSTGCVCELRPHYAMSADEIQQAKLVFNAGVQRAMTAVDSSMDDLQKAIALHDYICDYATYPDISDVDYDIYHSAYGFFYDGNVVCAGYALAYSYLLAQCDIESEYVVSRPMEHAWNAVKIGSKWYNADLTYDDITLYNNASNTRSAYMHRCFLLSSEQLEGEMGFYHFGGETHSNVDTSNTDYDDYFWRNVDTNIIIKDGYYYYLTASSPAYLMKRDADGIEERVGSNSFSSPASSVTSRNYDADNVLHETTYLDYFSRLVYLDNRFYINSSKSISSYYFNGERYAKNTILSGISDYVCGLGVDDNNQLVYQTTSDGTPQVLDKIDFWRSNITKRRNQGYNNYVDMNLDGYINGKDYIYIVKRR